MRADFPEDAIWTSSIAPYLADATANVHDISHYGFTEMVNNVIDHSESEDILVSFTRTAVTLQMLAGDTGVGIFNKIQSDLGFANKRDAIFELRR